MHKALLDPKISNESSQYDFLLDYIESDVKILKFKIN